jgi:hypothetical protein
MPLPQDVVSAEPQPSTFLNPDNITFLPHLVYERGGVDLQDTSEGNIAYTWRARYTNNAISIERDGIEGYDILTELANVISIDMTFDQNMNVIICYDIAGTSYLYWFDSVIQDYTTTVYPNTRSPRLTRDDKRPQFTTQSDVLFAYITAAGELIYRQQRDRYTIARTMTAGVQDSVYIEKIGMTTTNRVYFKLSPFYIMPSCPLNNIVSGLL